MANACCSIEMEPRTLSEGQLSQAIEVAADVVQKLVPKEASTTFFNKEVKPNFLIKEEEEEENKKGQEQPHDKFDVEREEKIIQVPCQCSNTQSPTELELKEPLSAPF